MLVLISIKNYGVLIDQCRVISLGLTGRGLVIQYTTSYKYGIATLQIAAASGDVFFYMPAAPMLELSFVSTSENNFGFIQFLHGIVKLPLAARSLDVNYTTYKN